MKAVKKDYFPYRNLSINKKINIKSHYLFQGNLFIKLDIGLSEYEIRKFSISPSVSQYRFKIKQ